MCTLIYLAVDTPIPLQPWNPGEPSFHVRSLDETENLHVRRFTSRSHTYYVGSAEKCGPFSYGANPGIDDSPAELQARATAIQQLVAVLEQAMILSTAVELLAFEADDWRMLQHRRQLTIADIANTGFAFVPPEAIEVVGAA